MDTAGWEAIWERLLLVISEQTGVSPHDIEAVLDAETAFWEGHPKLWNRAMLIDGDDE